MDVMIYTSDPDHVDPAEIADALEKANFFVMSVDVNDGERAWPEPTPKYGLAGDQVRRYDALVDHVGHDAALADARKWPTEEED